MSKILRVIGVVCVLVPCLISAQSQTAVTYDPGNLTPQWWCKTFEGTTAQKTQARHDVLAFLEPLTLQIPPENTETFQESLGKIESGLEEYLRLTQIRGGTLEAAPEKKQSYPLQEFLDTLARVYHENEQIRLHSMRITQYEMALGRVHQQIDALWLEYGQSSQHSLQRTMLGMQLMYAFVYRALLQEKERIESVQKQHAQSRMEWNKDLLQYAQRHVFISDEDMERITQQVHVTHMTDRVLQNQRLEIEGQLLELFVTPQGSLESLTIFHDRLEQIHQQVLGNLLKAQQEILRLSQSKNDPEEVERIVLTAQGTEQVSQEMGSLLDLAQQVMQKFEGQKVAEEHFVEWDEKKEQLEQQLAQILLQQFQTKAIAKMLSDQAVKNMVWYNGLGYKFFAWIDETTRGVLSWFHVPLFRVQENPITLWSLVQAGLVFCMALFVSNIFRRGLERLSQTKPSLSAATRYAFNRVAHYIIVSVGALMALGFIGLDFSNLLLIAGGLSVGIGFGLQGIVNNFLGGLILLFDRKIRVGDFIEMSNGEMGHISEVNVQNTVIRTITGHDILVPNSAMISRELTNWTLRDHFARLHVPFGIAYGTDKNEVKRVVEEAARGVEETVCEHPTLPGPNLWLVGFGDSSLNFELVVWVDLRRSRKRKSSLRAAYYWEIESAIIANGLEIPFPQRDIHIKSGDNSQKEVFRI